MTCSDRQEDAPKTVCGMATHDHACLIYETRQEQYSAMMPFISSGLKRGDRCLCVVDEGTAADVIDALRREGVDGDETVRTGALILLTSHEAYSREGCFDASRMIRFLEEATAAAIRDGYTALRITAEMAWVLDGDPGVAHLKEYGAGLARLLESNRALAICQYNRGRFRPEVILDVIHSHPLVIYGGTVCRNAHHIPPQDLLLPKEQQADRAVLRELQQLIGRERESAEKLRNEQLRHQAMAEIHRLRDALDRVSAFIYMKDRELRYVYANRPTLELFGCTAEELQGSEDARFFPPDTVRRLRAVDLRVLAGEQTGEEIDVPDAERGRRVYWEVKTPIYLDHAGGTWGLLGISTDITERKLAEEELLRSREAVERQLRFNDALLKAIPTPVFFKDTEGRYLGCNRAFTEIMGVGPADIAGKTVYEVWPDDAAQAYHKSDMQLMKTPAHQSYEFTLTDRHGERRNVIFDKDVFLNERGEVAGIVGSFSDITERKRAAEALQQSETLLRDIIDNVDEAILLIDRDYRILTANRVYCQWAQRPLDEIVGRACHSVSHGFERPCYEAGMGCAVREVFATGRPVTVLYRSEADAGGWQYVEKKAFPVRAADGTITAAIESARNVTERHLLEAERLKTQKLEAVGTLAGGIAHDFNNLLQGIFGYISMARLNFDRKEKALAMLGQAEEALQLTVNLTTQLLTFAKGGQPLKKRLGVVPTVENAARFALSGTRMECRIDAESPWQVEADAGQLAQVIQNIVLNAHEAMAGAGTVCITIGNVIVPPGMVMGIPEGGRFVSIAVRDAGTGILPQNLPRIFDPYFTTKQRGSGLGLATSYSIVRNHGGTIEVQSEVTKGSTFTIYLPAAEGTDEEERAAPAAASPVHAGRVLFMDDEEMMRRVATEMITSLGHEVTVAADGGEAIELYKRGQAAGRPFDIVILDLTVKGGMGGEEAIRRLSGIDAGVKAVVSSGYADMPVVAHYREYGFSAVLNKPYRIEALQECLAALLAR